jgi:hypothetical protein
MFVGILLTCNSHAQSTPTKIALAEQLTTLLHFEKLFNADIADCARPQQAALNATTVYRATPNVFGGISPKSVYWPEVVAIYGRYQSKTCEYASTEKFTRFFIEQFAEHASESDLRTAIAFYSTPAGKRIQNVAFDANIAFNAYASQIARTAQTETQAAFQVEIRALMKRYRLEPK